MKDFLDLIGRLCLAFIFLFEAFDSIVYYEATRGKMDIYGLTWNQDLFLIGAIILLLVGGVFLMIGYRAPFAALCLLLYWVPITMIIHSFWNDPEEIRRIQSILFMRNVAIIGGLLLVIANGSGRFSIKRLLDNQRLRPKDWK
jgi:putative oxidoreductase